MDNSYQHSTIAQILENILEEFVFEGESRSDIADILLSILNKTEYNKETDSVIADLLVRLKAKIEGSSFDPYDGDSTSRIADIIISILEETEYNEEPQSRIAELLLDLKQELESITEVTVSGSVVSFVTNMIAALVSCQSAISGYQEGSGTPSPVNVRPLHAFSSANIGQTSGYGEYFQGLLNGTYGFVDLGSLEWTSTERYFRADLPITPKTVNDRETPNAITNSQYQPIDFYSLYNNYGSYDDVFSITNGTAGSNKLYFRDTSYNDPIAFKTAMSGVYLIYELATPTTPSITPEQFATLCQAFGITGNTYTFTFGQSIYQGSIDWKRGVVVGTHGIVDLGSLTWLYNTQYANPIFYTNLVGAKLTPSAQKGDTLAEIFETYSARDMNTAGVDYAVAISEPYFFSSYNLYIVDSDYTDPTAFKTAMNGVMLAYELATPIEIPLEGIEILTVQGENNIYCDTGDSEVTYLYRGTPPQNTRLISKSIENIIQEEDPKDLKELDELQELDISDKEVK